MKGPCVVKYLSSSYMFRWFEAICLSTVDILYCRMLTLWVWRVAFKLRLDI
jgi:hypothetical protein